MMTIEKQPLWAKIKDDLYQIEDENGGIYQIQSQVEMTQEQLFSQWVYVYSLCGRARPSKGEVHLMVR